MSRAFALLIVALSVLTCAGGSITNEIRTYVADFTGEKPPDRLCVDIPVALDLTQSTSVAFDFSCEDLQTFSHLDLYFKSGGGWYKTGFAPRTEGKTERIRVPVRRLVRSVEGTPDGLDKITAVRLSAWFGAPNKCTVTFGNLRPVVTTDAAILVVRGKAPLYADGLISTVEALDVPCAPVKEDELTPNRLKGVDLVVLPYNPTLTDAAAKTLVDWATAGGRLFVCYEIPRQLDALVGVKQKRVPLFGSGKNGNAELGGFLRTGEGLRFQPAFANQRSHCCRVVEPREGSVTVAEWANHATKASLGMPALIRSPHALYLSHVWMGGDTVERLDFMRAVLAASSKRFERRFAEEKAAAEVRRQKTLADIARMPAKPGERRLFWCHSAFGLGGTNDWDSSVRFLKDNGFTDLVANLCWGGSAYYPSKVLAQATDCKGRDCLADCLAACRRHGIRLHVWKVCWNPSFRLPAEERARYQAEGRLQVRTRGGREEGWLCPSDPRNQQQEIDAMCELADRGVDGVHYDYIRYPGHDCCFCDGCRARFETKVGRRVNDWPAEIRTNDFLAAKWDEFRSGNISAVVGGVSRRLRAKHPKTEISAAVMRDATRDWKAIGQDWGRWCREGWLDFACPMDYTESGKMFRGHVRRQKAQVAGAKLYPGIGLSCWKEDGRDAERFAEQVKIVREEGVDGFIVFNFDYRAENVLPVMRTGPFSHQMR